MRRISLQSIVRVTVCLSTFVCAILINEPTFGAESAALEIRVVLHDAITFTGPVTPGAPAMLIDLSRSGDRWDRGWATSAGFGNKEPLVRVNAGAVTDDSMTFDLTVSEGMVGTVPGERVQYTVKLKKVSKGKFTGTYTGTVRGQSVQGDAEAEIKPARQTYPGYQPLQVGEHPRLLFRKTDVPALREKAETPFGRYALSKIQDNAAGLAFRYQITGNKSLAAEAQQRVEAIMKDVDHGDKRVRSRWFGYRVEQASLAYDMCYDAWSVEFRQQVAEYLLNQSQMLFFQRSKSVFDDHIGWSLGEAHAPIILSSAGMAGLALWGEKGSVPVKPVAPYAVRVQGALVEPAKDYHPGEGVSPVDFKSDVMPTNWLYAGVFPLGKDHLSDQGGMEGVRPFVGMKVTYEDKTTEWHLIADKKGYVTDTDPALGRTKIEINGPCGVVKYSTGYFYTVFTNNADRWVQFKTDNNGVEGYLNGVRIAPNEIIRLTSGLYPLLVPGDMGFVNPWGSVFMEPRLVELTAEEVAAIAETQKTEYAEQIRDWEFDMAEWKRTDGGDPRFFASHDHARFIMSLVLGEVPGEGGLALPGSALLTLDGVNKYAFAYRTVWGSNITPYHDIDAVLPYKMFVRSYRSDGKQNLGLEMNGPTDFVGAYYPDSSPKVTGDYFATLFPLVRDEWKPSALWAWQTLTGGNTKDEASIAKLMTFGARGYAMERPYGTFYTYPIYAFVSYPLSMTPQAPKAIMPLTWQAPRAGFYGFRNGWSGGDDEVITHFYASTHGGGAGTLRLIGLGDVWSHGVNASAQERYGENVVQLPDDDINDKARGEVVYLWTDPDGSGSLTVNLNDVYTAPKDRGNGKMESLYDKYSVCRRPTAFVDQGITGLRAMAVDYSGKSGAPCLVVIVDKIRGGKRKLWTWQLESKQELEHATRGDQPGTLVFMGKQFKDKNGHIIKKDTRKIANDPRVKVETNGFTLTQKSASMRATFVSPKESKVEFAEHVEWRQGSKFNVGKSISKTISAEGGDDYFVVLTLQQGAAPEVKVSGTGLDARVTVGKRVVTFDGEKIVFGE